MTGVTNLFDESTEGKRRQMLFTIFTLTGIVCIVAGMASIALPTGVTLVGGILLAAGFFLFAFAGYVQQGGFPSLFEDKQLFWQIGD